MFSLKGKNHDRNTKGRKWEELFTEGSSVLEGDPSRAVGAEGHKPEVFGCPGANLPSMSSNRVHVLQCLLNGFFSPNKMELEGMYCKIAVE